MKCHMQEGNEHGHAHDASASVGMKVRVGAQAPPQQGEAGQQCGEVGGNVGCVEPRRVGRLLGPDLPKHGKVGENW